MGGRVRVLFDATRLISRGNSTPTGIDRVDMAYVSALARAPGIDLRLILFDVFGPRLLSSAYCRQLVDGVMQRWQLSAPSLQSDSAFSKLMQWLQHPRPSPLIERTQSNLQPVAAAEAPKGKHPSRRLPQRKLSKPTIYLNTSHGRLYRRSVSRWLKATGTPGVFFIHDLIPIEFPQFNRAAEPAKHAARLQTISRTGHQVLVNSRTTRDSLSRYAATKRLILPPVQVAPLGIEQRFTARTPQSANADAAPYFVVLGTIEPRKNHQLLLDIWSSWIRDGKQGIPHLIIVGRRGWNNAQVFDALDNTSELGRYVAECSSLSDTHVTALLQHARALLCPSFAEGFSLPVVEALALGTPVIASDIAAHTEVDQGCSERINPHASLQWAEMIEEYTRSDSHRRRSQIARLEHFQAPTWSSHFAEVLPVLHRIAHES